MSNFFTWDWHILFCSFQGFDESAQLIYFICLFSQLFLKLINFPLQNVSIRTFVITFKRKNLLFSPCLLLTAARSGRHRFADSSVFFLSLFLLINVPSQAKSGRSSIWSRFLLLLWAEKIKSRLKSVPLLFRTLLYARRFSGQLAISFSQ